MHDFPATTPRFLSLPGLEDERLDSLRDLPLRLQGTLLEGEKLEAFAKANESHGGMTGDLARFILEWRNPSPFMGVKSSGSTGAPKTMQVEKRRMAQSARRTCAFLGLEEGDGALLAMPLRFIAGKMVVVRALVQGLDLLPVEPCARPLDVLGVSPTFAAMTPMQAYESLQNPASKALLFQVRELLLGGGSVEGELAEALRAFPQSAWSSYGMTETLSHIALRRINGPDASEWYMPLPGVRLGLTEEGALAIDAPSVAEGKVVTNDRAEIDAGGRFRILGRLDNVIDSGGVKIQIEQAESALASLLPGEFCMTGVPDARLGEMAVLLCAFPPKPGMERLCKESLPPYWAPRRLFQVESIPKTGTGKIARGKAKEAAALLWDEARKQEGRG